MNDTTRPYPVLPALRHGLLAGGAAGLVTGLFALLLAEPVMDRAIALEEERSAASGSGHDHAAGHAAEAEEVFSRGTQHFGLVVTAVVVGLAVGVFFALVYSLVHRGVRAGARSGEAPGAREWPRAMTLAGAAFLALSLLPALRYPATPPGVGDGGTVAERQLLWLAALVIGVLGMALAWQLHLRLADRAQPVRHLAVAGAVAATGAVLFLLPGNPDPVPVPPELLWDFRVLSLLSHGLMWATLGAVFGVLGMRAATARPASDREPRPAPAG
ncbi:CbtA family protein [Streptomyces sp. 549]|uniref:CbtA family protein n=1 Tax=Streptomyces sp. 549 TaxID=3049076 RepID=UPI0024C392E3|nr:CbtA family protein [Streptomyces sp. 549]MDK1473758.1 CbtA family protein [Streptomyces sp. 549]